MCHKRAPSPTSLVRDSRRQTCGDIRAIILKEMEEIESIILETCITPQGQSVGFDCLDSVLN